LSCPNAIQLRVFLIHPAPAETSTLSLHDALPISSRAAANGSPGAGPDLDGAEAAGEAPGIDRTPKMYIGGRQTRPDGGYTRRIHGPGGRLVGEVGEGNRKDIRNAVEAAHKADGWRAMSGHQRAQVLYYVGENLAVRRDEFAGRLAAMTGCSESEAYAEVDAAV